MAKEKLEGITIKKTEDFSEWYNQVVLKAELADYAPVRGFMAILPRGYAIWENIQATLDKTFSKKGVKNAYFPLLIPESFFKKEAEHAKGFAPELAWVEKGEEGERVAIRPTSETIIYDFFSKWVRSWRDLPLRINQWCNVLRWEVKQTKLFLRTREFLWQEGHCAYTNEQDCVDEALWALGEYKKFCEEYLAIPVLDGKKTEAERFAGAKDTFTIEALMPDGRGLQMGTAHNLGQNFAKTFGVKYLNQSAVEEFAWQNSWGVSTRLIGAMVMVHSDDRGLVIPPMIAKEKVVIVPIIFEDTKKKVLDGAKKLAKALESFGAFVDERDQYSSGWKFNEWELKGTPIRIEFGPKDLQKKQCVVVRRDTGEKKFVKITSVKKEVSKLLEQMQSDLFNSAKKFLQYNTVEVTAWPDFEKGIESRKIVLCYFCEDKDCEAQIKVKTGASSKCIPFGQKKVGAFCLHCGKPAFEKVYFAKSY